MIDVEKLRALLAYNNSRHWYPRGRFVSLVPDDSPYSASHPFRHVANFPDHDMTELACAAVNALPQLLAIAEAALLWRHGMVEVSPGCYVDSDDGNVDQGLESKPARAGEQAGAECTHRRRRRGTKGGRMSVDIDKLRALLAGATPGPWTPMRDGNQYVNTSYMPTAKAVAASRIEGPVRPWNPHAYLARGFKPAEFETVRFTDADADLVCALVNTAPELLAIAEAAMACARNGTPDTYLDLRIAVDAARKAGA